MAGNISAAYYRAMATANAAIGEAVSKFGADTTYDHIMSVLAEAATRELPKGTHYLRNAVDEADASRKRMEDEQAAWELGRESGFYSNPSIIRLAPHGGCNWAGCRECFPRG